MEFNILIYMSGRSMGCAMFSDSSSVDSYIKAIKVEPFNCLKLLSLTSDEAYEVMGLKKLMNDAVKRGPDED